MLPFFQISGNVCENDALIILVRPDTIVEAETFSSFAFT